VGARVGVKFIADTCLACPACLEGDDMNCADVLISSINKEGTFQRYVVVAAHHLVPIPDGVPLEVAAPILCAGITTYKALLAASLRPGAWVAVPGAGGGLGHLAVQYALALNLRVVGIDAGEEKRALVEGYGATFVDFRAGDVVKAVKEVTGGGVQGAIVTAGVIGPYQQVSENPE
jgi:propanol-preferring alcohol dehydrogenase